MERRTLELPCDPILRLACLEAKGESRGSDACQCDAATSSLTMDVDDAERRRLCGAMERTNASRHFALSHVCHNDTVKQ